MRGLVWNSNHWAVVSSEGQQLDVDILDCNNIFESDFEKVEKIVFSGSSPYDGPSPLLNSDHNHNKEEVGWTIGYWSNTIVYN